MAATFTSGGGNTTVTHTVVGVTAKILNGYSNAAEALWKRTGGTPEAFAALTNQQKLNIVHAWFIDGIKQLAKSNMLEEGEESGKASALTDYNTNVEVIDA